MIFANHVLLKSLEEKLVLVDIDNRKKSLFSNNKQLYLQTTTPCETNEKRAKKLY